ncbi:MAG: nitroreductase family deazaflavin-dependent oxidoreductase, partial [Gammaproteobacteria bacterium]|nr:nitroreductase family deazaflavin-dependent oxidoreductase [Gammaproteobacteria bacterium]
YLIAALLLPCPQVDARMYQWQDPNTETTQLSGRPPSWYRSAQAGPRVFVFESGRIIDDTAVVVPVEQRDALRQQALTEAGGDQERALEQARASAKLEAAFESKGPQAGEVEVSTEIEAPSKAEQAADTSVSSSIEALKALISAWDKSRIEEAKMIVESQDVKALDGPRADESAPPASR